VTVCGIYLERYLKIESNAVSDEELTTAFSPSLTFPDCILLVCAFNYFLIFFSENMNKKDFLLSIRLKLCFYRRVMLPSCTVYSTNNWGPATGTSSLSRFRHKASNY